MSRIFAVVVVCLTAVAVLAAPRRALAATASEDAAAAAVEAERTAVDREKTRIEWPDRSDEPPPDGAEVWLIHGYVRYRVTRMVRRGDRVEARTVDLRRSRRYGADDSFSAEEFDVPLDAFATAWNAARRVAEARLVRNVEPPNGLATTRWSRSTSHEASLWVRLRDGSDAAPWHASVARGAEGVDDGVQIWDSVRDRAVFHLMEKLVPETGRTRSQRTEWGPWFSAEIARTTPAASAALEPVQLLLLETSLEGASEFGGPETIAVVAALDASVRGAPPYWRRERLLDDCWEATTRLRLRHAFDPQLAAEAIARPSVFGGRRWDLVAWTKRRWRAADPTTYETFMLRSLEAGAGQADLLAECLQDLSGVTGDAPAGVARRLLGHPSHVVRAAAAALLLARDRRDPVALDAMLGTSAAAWTIFESDDAIRAALASGDEDGRWVRVAIETLSSPSRGGFSEQAAAGTSLELAAWRGVLAQPPHPGTGYAVKRLIALRDRESFPEIAAMLRSWETDEKLGDAAGMQWADIAIARERMREVVDPAPK